MEQMDTTSLFDSQIFFASRGSAHNLDPMSKAVRAPVHEQRSAQGSDRTAFPERERFDVNFRAPNTTYDARPLRSGRHEQGTEQNIE